MFNFTIEIAIIYCGEHTYLRLFLASMKKYYAGIPIEKITIVTGNLSEEELLYLHSRDDINVITYKDIDSKIPNICGAYERFMYKDATADYVVWVHSDAIPINNDWLLPSIVICRNNNMSVYVEGHPIESYQYNGIDVYSDVVCFNAKFYKEQFLGFAKYGDNINYPIFRNKFFNHFIGRVQENAFVTYENFTLIMGRVMEMGYNPIISYFNDYMHENFIKHIGCGGTIFGIGMQYYKEFPMYIEERLNYIKSLFFDKDNKDKYHFIDLIRNDGYPTFLSDPVLGIVIDSFE